MNDSDLEQNLRALRPAPPAPALEQRIAKELAGAAPAAGVLRRAGSGAGLSRWLRDLGWAVAGAAAAWAALAALAPVAPHVAPIAPEASAPALADTFEHASATEELLATQDATELIETEDGLVRPVLYTYRERHAWANPLTGARMEIEVPREEVYLMPVSLQ